MLAALLALQSLVSLRDGRRFLAFVRRSQETSPREYSPFTSVIIPCKGIDADLETNLACFLAQDCPAYQVVFVVANENDPAWRFLSEHLNRRAGGGPKTSLVVAGYADDPGGKVNNLLRGLVAVEPAAEVLMFADIDARPGRDWLRSLVAPLADSQVTVSTGFRWYLPGANFASQLRTAWDTSVATLLGDHDHNFAWGGSMAIRAADFRRLQIAERYWAHTVSDDYSLTRAVREAGGRIRFEPRCLVASREESSFADFLRWSNRQIIITRVYAPHLWRLGLASHLLYCLTFLFGLGLLVCPAPTLLARAAIAARYWQLAPLVPWVMLYNFLVAGFTRRIEWQGTHYEPGSRDEFRVLRRDG